MIRMVPMSPEVGDLDSMSVLSFRQRLRDITPEGFLSEDFKWFSVQGHIGNVRHAS